MSKNSLAFLTSYFIIIFAIRCASDLLATIAPTLLILIASPALLSDHVEVLIKEARAQVKHFREDTEMEARETAVVAVRPFENADELLLAWGKKYRLEMPDQVLVGLKVEHSGFGTINVHSFGSNFVEETRPFRRRDEGDGQEGKSKPHILRLLRR